MTVIAYDGRYVAADTLLTSESGMIGRCRKLTVFGTQVLTHTGAADHGHAMELWFKDEKRPDAFPKPGVSREDAYLYAFEHGKPIMCFQSWAAPVIILSEEFAGGSGGPYALAALHLGRDAREAVKVACALNVYCGGEVEYVDLAELATTGKAQVRRYAD